VWDFNLLAKLNRTPRSNEIAVWKVRGDRVMLTTLLMVFLKCSNLEYEFSAKGCTNR